MSKRCAMNTGFTVIELIIVMAILLPILSMNTLV